MKEFILTDLSDFLHILFSNFYAIRCFETGMPNNYIIEVLRSDGTSFDFKLNEVEKSIVARTIIRKCEVKLNLFGF